MSDQPEISVVIASYNSGATIGRTLESVFAQETARPFEAIVVDSSEDGTGDMIEQQFPQVRLFRLTERAYPGAARNAGIAQARSPIIAFLDADCVAAKDWIERVAGAHQSPHPAIGGAVGNAPNQGPAGWAAYFCEFNKWMPGTSPRWMDDVPGASMTYKTEIFSRYGEFRGTGYGSDTEFNWKLNQDNIPIWFEPSIQVFHVGIDNMSELLKHELFHGRSYAVVRIREQRFSRLKRWAYVVAAPLVFLRLFSRAAFQSIRTKVYLRQFLVCLPWTALAVSAWACGETIGYARGR